MAASDRSSSVRSSSAVSHRGSTIRVSAPPGCATSTATRTAVASRSTGTWSTTGTRASSRLPTSTASSSARATATTSAADRFTVAAASAYPVPLGTSATTGPASPPSASSHTPRPTAAPACTSVRPPMGTTASRPVSAPATVPLTTPVWTGVSRATAPRVGVSPTWAAILRTRAAAAVIDVAEPLAPRVGTCWARTGDSASSTTRASTISVVALPMSMPATRSPVMAESWRCHAVRPVRSYTAAASRTNAAQIGASRASSSSAFARSWSPEDRPGRSSS